MQLAWYALLLLCITTLWQSSIALFSAFMIAYRSSHVARFSISTNLCRNVAVLLLVCGTLYQQNILQLGGAASFVKCSGWNVWALVVIPRSLWFFFLMYDLVVLLYDSKYRLALWWIAAVIHAVYLIVSFGTMTLSTSVHDSNSPSGLCNMAHSVYVVNWIGLGVSWAACLLMVVFPWREFVSEVFRRRVLRVCGVSFIPEIEGRTVVEFMPTTYEELDRWLMARQAVSRFVGESSSSSLLSAAAASESDGGAYEDPSREWTDTYPPIDINFQLAASFDIRNRGVCLQQILLSALLALAFLYPWTWTHHIAWRCVCLVLTCVPLIHWQYASCVRPTYCEVQTNDIYIQGAEALNGVQTKQMRRYLNDCGDYRRDLEEYVSTSKMAEFRSAERVDQWLRVPYTDKDGNFGERDKYLEFQLFLAIVRRMQLVDPMERRAAATVIMFTFFQSYSPYYVGLPSEAGAIVLGTGQVDDDIAMFDATLLALTARLEPRNDESIISKYAKFMIRQRQQTPAPSQTYQSMPEVSVLQ